MKNFAAIALALVLAGCSLVRPGGPTLALFDAAICVEGSLNDIPQPPIPCFVLPNVQLPDDSAEFVNFASGLAAFYAGPLAADIGMCRVGGESKPGDVPGSVVATATIVCPTDKGKLVQAVSVSLTRSPVQE